MILFVGQVAREMREREAFQELDYRAVFGTMAKWATEIDDPARIPEIVSRAFYAAMQRPARSGGDRAAGGHADRARRGAGCARRRAGRDLAGPHRHGRLQKLLWAAKQPIVHLGGSRWSEDAVRRADALCRALRAAGRDHVPPRRICSTRLHPSYAGDLGIGPNPKLLARVKAADLVLLVGGRMGEMPSQSYTLLDIPEPQMKFVHVHPGADELGRVYRPHLAHQRGADRVLRGARRPAAAERDPLARRAPRPRMPTISPGPRRRRSMPGAVNLGEIMVWLRDKLPAGRDHHQRRRQFLRLDPSLLPLPQVRARMSARPPARWATACRPRSAMKRLYPERTGGLRRRRRRFPDERAGIRDRRAIRSCRSSSSSPTTACTAPSACTRSANIPGRVIAHRAEQSGFRRLCAARSAASARWSRRPQISRPPSPPRRHPASRRSSISRSIRRRSRRRRRSTRSARRRWQAAEPRRGTSQLGGRTRAMTACLAVGESSFTRSMAYRRTENVVRRLAAREQAILAAARAASPPRAAWRRCRSPRSPSAPASRPAPSIATSRRRPIWSRRWSPPSPSASSPPCARRRCRARTAVGARRRDRDLRGARARRAAARLGGDRRAGRCARSIAVRLEFRAVACRRIRDAHAASQ